MFGLRVSSLRFWFVAVAGLMLAGGAVWAGHGGGGHGGGGHGGGGHGGGAHFGGAHFGGAHFGGIGHVGGVGIGHVGGVGGVGLGGFGVGAARFGAFHPGVTAINRNVFVAPRIYGFGFPRGLGYGLGIGFGRGYGFGLGYGGYGYGYGGYGYGYGGYPYGYGNTYVYSAPTYNDYTSYYSQQQQQEPDDAAHILVVVPSDAELWFNGAKTSQTGTQRDFVSPVLKVGKNYTYEIKVRWTDNGKPVEQTRTVHVQANSWQVVDFTRTDKTPEKSPPSK